MEGKLRIGCTLVNVKRPSLPVPSSRLHLGFYSSSLSDWGYTYANDGIVLPYWLCILVLALITVASWFPRRFSLRALLIGTTLVAVVLGLIAWLIR